MEGPGPERFIAGRLEFYPARCRVLCWSLAGDGRASVQPILHLDGRERSVFAGASAAFLSCWNRSISCLASAFSPRR